MVGFIDELEPDRVALTFRSDYGYEVAPGRVINPWFEIFFAHCYALGQLLGLPADVNFDQLRKELSATERRPRVTYYFGFDNSYYYGVLFPLLARILDVPEMMPVALKANKFLRIRGSKVSSSRGNVIWVHDLAARYSGDVSAGCVGVGLARSGRAGLSRRDACPAIFVAGSG